MTVKLKFGRKYPKLLIYKTVSGIEEKFIWNDYKTNEESTWHRIGFSFKIKNYAISFMWGKA